MIKHSSTHVYDEIAGGSGEMDRERGTRGSCFLQTAKPNIPCLHRALTSSTTATALPPKTSVTGGEGWASDTSVATEANIRMG